MAIIDCPACGNRIDEDDGFCGRCGHILDEELLAAPAPVDLGGLEAAAFDEPTDAAPPPLFDDDAFDDDAPPRVLMGSDFDDVLEELTGAFVMNGGGPGVFEADARGLARDMQAMMGPQVILGVASGKDLGALSPFEQHVVSFIDGQRPLARVRKLSGLLFADLKIAIGLLADRGVLERKGEYKQQSLAAAVADLDLDESGEHAVPSASRPLDPFGADLAVEVPSPPAAAPAPVVEDHDVAVPAAAAIRPAADRPAPRAAAKPAAAPKVPAPVIDHARRARAMQLCEQALGELRAGRKAAAIALIQMAGEVAPGDPKIEALLKSWKGI